MWKKYKHDNKFDLFQIVDMQRLYPDIVCFACARGMNCKRHPLHKATHHLATKDQFIGVQAPTKFAH